MPRNSKTGRGDARLRTGQCALEGFSGEGRQSSPDPWRRVSPSVDPAEEDQPAQGQGVASRTLLLGSQSLLPGAQGVEVL